MTTLPSDIGATATITLGDMGLSENSKFLHNGRPCTVILWKDKIRVGCSVISINAANKLMELHKTHFPDTAASVVIQPTPPTL